jgi:hypothetical protein
VSPRLTSYRLKGKKGVRRLTSLYRLKNYVGYTEAGKENACEDDPENNPQFTTVYVGNLPHEVIPLS